MSFIRAKAHRNKKKEPRIYYFLVKNYRVKGKKTPKQAVIMFLGRYKQEPKKEHLIQTFPSLKNQIEEYFDRIERKVGKRLEEAGSILSEAKTRLKEVKEGYDKELSS